MFYADAVVAVRVEDRIAAAAKAAQIASHLLVQPDVLEARAVVDAVDHLGHPRGVGSLGVAAIVRAAPRALWICRCAWTTLPRRPQLHRANISKNLIQN